MVANGSVSARLLKEVQLSQERITGKAFHDAGGVDDWRVLAWGAYAFYRTGSFAEGARFVNAISEIADTTGHGPDVDLRPDGVTIRTFSREDGALGPIDIDFARRVSVLAQELGLRADPSQVQVVGIAIAQDAGVDVRPFWAAAFGYKDLGDEDAIDPNRRNPHLWFHELAPPRPGRGRVHIDLYVPADQIEARVQAALAAGGRVANDSRAPEWWTLTSPDNHGVDIAAWPDFEDYGD
jgi:4a-hydroxytetrahydrobiopterin dehydratase